MTYVYKPKGVCSREFEFELEGTKILSVKITGGCSGNLRGISRLITGKDINEIIEALEGVTCGFKPTSCPDQIAKALIAYRSTL
ncbi:MAG: TIGR03905 family TSCPD domain-containing protein [Erysipelotrichaceae bacterium]|nr:TIGR03905 family TSCPD domain-containing protein [Erysipelotrichaceae bacterium]